jgi:glycosyltransferase involved in cell wall biosynthesis
MKSTHTKQETGNKIQAKKNARRVSKKKPVIVVIMPAYNAEKTLKRTIDDIPKGFVSKIILTDDGSKDNTVALAKKLGLTVFVHPNNLGYGGNQKTCYWEALKMNPDAVVMLHPDYQYDATRLRELCEPILMGRYDMVMGSRIRTRAEALAGGMPPVKYYLNRFTTLVENMVLGINLSEHFSGLRAYSKKCLTTVPWGRFSNDFVFDQQFEVVAVEYGFHIGETPVPTRYFSEASSIGFIKGSMFMIGTYWELLKFLYRKAIGKKL